VQRAGKLPSQSDALALLPTLNNQSINQSVNYPFHSVTIGGSVGLGAPCRLVICLSMLVAMASVSISANFHLFRLQTLASITDAVHNIKR